MKPPSYEQFLSGINTDFTVARAGERTELLLLSRVEPLRGGADPACFSLLFSGQAADYLPQRTYLFAHTVLGQFELFIVPLGPDKASGLMRYEAIFN